MLAVLVTILMFSQGLSLDNCGTSFITAFPENIASYYLKSYNLLKITTLHPDTTINVTYMAINNVTTNTSLCKGIVWTVNLTKQVEESQFVSSNKTFRITSDKNITVLSVSGWEGRFQSHVVQPEQNLGKVYQVPSLNYTTIATSFNLTMTSNVQFMPFRLMIINAVDSDNSVTIKWVDENGRSQEDTYIHLESYNLYQVQINGSVKQINTDDIVAVILTHPCFDSNNCSCNMILNQLQPYESNDNNDQFLIPSIFSAKQLLVTTNKPFKVSQGSLTPNTGVSVRNSSDILPLLQKNNISLISTSIQVSLQLISPGLVLDLIPISKFSGCYLLNLNSSGSGALIIANKFSTGDVRMNNERLPSQIKWNEINGTGYSWALMEGVNISTIWHPFERIGVYMIEHLESNNTYLSQATVINMDPDEGGCLVTPEMFVLGEDEMSWMMSRVYCMQNADLFARLNNESSQNKMASNMTQGTDIDEHTEGWISLRRSLLSTDWYWKNEDTFSPNVSFTYWEKGQPDKPEKGLCASVSLDPDKKYKWKSSPCCSKKKPVCYKGPKYFTLSNTL